MPDSFKRGQLITLAEAARELPGRPHINTVRRWCDRGFRGVVLKSWRCGRRRVTSPAAIDEFISATTGIQATAKRETSAGHQWAEAALDRMGIDSPNRPP